jgi:acetyl esterase
MTAATNTSNDVDSREGAKPTAQVLSMTAYIAAQGRLAISALGSSGTYYHADTDMRALLNAYSALAPQSPHTLTAREARLQPSLADAAIALLEQQGKETWPLALIPGVTTFDEVIQGPESLLSIRIYMPVGVGPFPVVVYFHGGGWALGNKERYDSSARGIAKHANAVVVSVDFRLAPEALFPAQHDDALAAYQWACSNAASINGDPERIALAGECAGGTLALDTAITARRNGLQSPLHVLAIYPIAQSSGMLTPAHLDCELAKPLNRATVEWLAAQAFATSRSRAELIAHEPLIDLVDADLDLLPSVTLISARIDPLRSDGDMLAAAIRRAGVDLKHTMYDGVTHDFFGMAAVLAKAKLAQSFAGERLMQALRGS